MKKLALIFSIFLASIIGMVSCEEVLTFSDVPEIEFKSIYIADTLDAAQNQVKLQRLVISITDGDGDFGIYRKEDDVKESGKKEENGDSDSESDENKDEADDGQVDQKDSLANFNLFLTLSYKDKDSTYKELTDFSQGMRYRVPYKEPLGQNKYLKAEITIKIELPLTELNKYETVRYSIQAVDQQKHFSEIIETVDIPIRKHGIVYADGKTSFIEDKEEKQN